MGSFNGGFDLVKMYTPSRVGYAYLIIFIYFAACLKWTKQVFYKCICFGKQ